MDAAADNGAARRGFYDDLKASGLAPLWEVMGELVPPQPAPACSPFHWPFSRVQPHLERAQRLITAAEAERRVLVLENPRLAGASRITRSLYAGIQTILPGEVAHSHRHTATAIRVVMKGRGAYTSVDGERTPMEPGDFIITPSWTYHDHANPGNEPVVWLDGLDVPVIQLFEAGFSDRYPAARHPELRPQDVSLAAFGENLAPDGPAGKPARNPLFRYPFARVRPALDKLASAGEPDSRHGFRLQYTDPTTGGAATRTLAAFIQWLPGGFQGTLHKSTESRVFCVIEGEGTSWVGDERYDWMPHDIFVVPPWVPLRHASDRPAILFSFSDRPVQLALGIWREA